MSEYRNRTTGEIKSQGEWRKDYPNTSFPRVWSQETLNGLNLDAVLRSPASTVGDYQTSARVGVKQDALGNWVENHVARDMFADTIVEGVTTTKAQHEVAYQAGLDEKLGESVRAERSTKLKDTDWQAVTDRTMTGPELAYRQALRDLPAQAGFPKTHTWPNKP